MGADQSDENFEVGKDGVAVNTHNKKAEEDENEDGEEMKKKKVAAKILVRKAPATDRKMIKGSSSKKAQDPDTDEQKKKIADDDSADDSEPDTRKRNIPKVVAKEDSDSRSESPKKNLNNSKRSVINESQESRHSLMPIKEREYDKKSANEVKNSKNIPMYQESDIKFNLERKPSDEVERPKSKYTKRVIAGKNEVKTYITDDHLTFKRQMMEAIKHEPRVNNEEASNAPNKPELQSELSPLEDIVINPMGRPKKGASSKSGCSSVVRSRGHPFKTENQRDYSSNAHEVCFYDSVISPYDHKVSEFLSVNQIKDRARRDFKFPSNTNAAKGYRSVTKAQYVSNYMDKAFIENTWNDCIGYNKNENSQGSMVKLNFPERANHNNSKTIEIKPYTTELKIEEDISPIKIRDDERSKLKILTENPVSVFLRDLNKDLIDDKHNANKMAKIADDVIEQKSFSISEKKNGMSQYGQFIMGSMLGHK